jgi:hypothetical protein
LNVTSLERRQHTQSRETETQGITAYRETRTTLTLPYDCYVDKTNSLCLLTKGITAQEICPFLTAAFVSRALSTVCGLRLSAVILLPEIIRIDKRSFYVGSHVELVCPITTHLFHFFWKADTTGHPYAHALMTRFAKKATMEPPRSEHDRTLVKANRPIEYSFAPTIGPNRTSQY